MPCGSIKPHVRLTLGEAQSTTGCIDSSSKPFGAVTQGITTLPSDVAAPLEAFIELRDNLVLSVEAGAVATGDHTLYFFNNSQSTNVVTQSAQVTCLCRIAQ